MNKIYKNRRKKLIDLLESESSILILSNQTQYKNSDIEYRFRQDSSFWYLTGLNENDSALLIIKHKNNDYDEILFTKARNKNKEIWTGHILGLERASEYTEIKKVYRFNDLEDFFENNNICNFKKLYFDFAGNSYLDLRKKILQIAKQKRCQEIINSEYLISELRIIKEDYEIDLIKKSAKINCNAHKTIIEMCMNNNFKYEYQVYAEFSKMFLKENANYAYEPIIASGKNASILHYVANNQEMKKNDLLLLDVGCEYEYYASDITRTIPLGKKFNSAQKAIYDIVLKANIAAKEQAFKLNATIQSVHDVAVKEIIKGLIDLKILKTSFDEALETKSYMKFFMHKTSHWLGLDTHDVGFYTEKDNSSKILKTGMLFTIEPAIYFNEFYLEDYEVPKEFLGIGIRIEDNLLKTDSACEVLTEIPIKL